MKQLDIRKGGNSITIVDSEDGFCRKRCHILTESYGEVTSVLLNKTDVKRVINWLNKWLKELDGEKK